MSGGSPPIAVANSYMYIFAEEMRTPLLLVAAKEEAKSLRHVPRTLSTPGHASRTVGSVGQGGGWCAS